MLQMVCGAAESTRTYRLLPMEVRCNVCPERIRIVDGTIVHLFILHSRAKPIVCLYRWSWQSRQREDSDTMQNLLCLSIAVSQLVLWGGHNAECLQNRHDSGYRERNTHFHIRHCSISVVNFHEFRVKQRINFRWWIDSLGHHENHL